LNVLSVSLGQGFLFDAIDGWGEVLALPVAARMVALRDPATRDRMRAGARETAGKPTGRVGIIAALADVTVGESHSPDNAAFVGRTIGDIARASGSDLLDTMLDIALGDDLRTRFAIPDLGDDDESWAMRAEVWQRDEVVIGGSDAGAHLDVMCSATYTTNLLGQAVRERGLLPLAQAVRLVTDVPARLYGLRRRGRLARGFAGDIVVFDPATVAARPPVTRHDLPGGSPRLFAESIGVGDVVVNGAAVVREGAVTGTLPGRVLRRGVDTETRHPGRWRA
jgi:N-acyl-D-aspartate/D-glutamate deacylase